MTRFVVLDHSLTCVGGHHYEQAVQVLLAAQRLGYDPVLATNVKFDQQDQLPLQCPVLPVFPEISRNSLRPYPLDIDGCPLSLPGADSCYQEPAAGLAAWRKLSRWSEQVGFARRIRQFAEALAAVDAEIHLNGSDQVLLPTTTLFDLLGVARFLQSAGTLPHVIWHASFHYGFLHGREPEHEQQVAIRVKMRRQLEYLLEVLAPNPVRFYGTTDKLVQQFNRLGLARFEVLPFPADGEAFLSEERGRGDRPFRITCAGYLRREKGKSRAGKLVQDLWEDELSRGRMQLVAQTNRRQARRMVPTYDPSLLGRLKSFVSSRSEIPRRFPTTVQDAGPRPVVWLQHPLSREDYSRVIRDSDAALFLHEGPAYYSRCSGVLVDVLTGGLPVVVPAGSWLAGQVAEPIYEHLDQLVDDCPSCGHVTTQQLSWYTTGPQPRLGKRQANIAIGGPWGALVCESAVPAGAHSLLVSFAWPETRERGVYLRVRVERQDVSVRRTTTSDAVVMEPAMQAVLEPRTAGNTVSALFHFRRPMSHVRVTISNAYGAAVTSVRDLVFHFLAAPLTQRATYPAGRVGLIYSGPDELPEAVRNIRDHYAHFQASALEFARQWRDRHDANRIVRSLVACPATVGRSEQFQLGPPNTSPEFQTRHRRSA